MKVCFVSETFYPPHIGGAEISTSILAHKLADLGIDIFLITSKIDGRSEFEKKKNLKIFRVFDKIRSKFFNENIFLSKFRNSIASYISKIDRKYDIDIFHAHNRDSILGLAKSNINKLKIATIRDFWPFCPKRDLEYNDKLCDGMNFKCHKCLFFRDNVSHPRLFLRPIWNSYIINLQKKFQKNLEGIDKIIAISNYMKKIISPFFSNVETIYNPIEDKDINFNSSWNNKILFVGKLHKSKGIKNLIFAFYKVLKSKRDLKLIIIGQGPLKPYIQKLIAKLNLSSQIKLIDKVSPSNLEKYYLKSDAVVFPSIWNEPFGRVIVEAFSYGKPVIATKVGAIDEIVKNDKNGFLVEANNINSLSKAILNIYKDNERYIGLSKKAKDTANNFRSERIAKEVINFYKKLLVN